ncbi:uncharacterized protein LOC132747933 [Ruditapes philippinarum]|uniref:uncharacterized protein LOC132747933 n=1 Tax=Ruditapes philippinarum TaxID=129788 RepID=UPI00295A6F54|nr:uncharacterized protein LOC132747933 [Ruditapes philippinarum]
MIILCSAVSCIKMIQATLPNHADGTNNDMKGVAFRFYNVRILCAGYPEWVPIVTLREKGSHSVNHASDLRNSSIQVYEQLQAKLCTKTVEGILFTIETFQIVPMLSVTKLKDL